MRYCKKCVQPDTRPSVYFNDEGVCGACLYAEEIKIIDWDKRKQKLIEIAERAKKKAKENKVGYDCAIGVSGGKDSTFQALYARDELKLRPLLVNCEPEGLTKWGKKNIENIKNLGFDVLAIRPNPIVMKKLIKRDFFKHVNPVKITEFSLWASTYIMAQVLKIPLIIQGENDNLTLGTRNKQGLGGDALLVTEQSTLASGWEEYIDDVDDSRDLFLYHFDSDGLRESGVEAIWLQYYVKEWGFEHNTEFSIKHGLSKREGHDPALTGRINPYCSIDGDIQIVNQLLKFIKFGFGFVTDEVCYYIREGKMKREEAIELVKKYDGKCGDNYIEDFCKYIGITKKEFWRIANSVRGPMWKKNNQGEWELDGAIWQEK